MKVRLFFNISAFVALSMLAAFMVRQEEVKVKTERKVEEFKDVFIKYEREYRELDREENFQYFGMTIPMITIALQSVKKLEKEEKRLLKWLQESRKESPEYIMKAFCALEPNERPRYEAIAFLIEEEDSELRVIKTKRRTKIEYQPWVEAISIKDIHNFLELRAEPQKNATIMFVAAVLLNEIETLNKEAFPFGKGSSWSWKEVVELGKKRNRNIRKEVSEYLALMHILTEIAQDPNTKICNSK